MSTSRIWVVGAVILSVGLLAGCTEVRTGAANGPSSIIHRATPRPGSEAVVEQYLRAAADADGARMFALVSSGERGGETPETLRKTAADRYTTATTWEVLKTSESGGTSEVVVDVHGAKVDPNPTTFTLTRENGEWRIIDSPELHERKKDGGIHIRL